MRTNFLRDRAASVLAGAERALHVNFNLKDWHWALMRVQFKYPRCEVYVSTGHIKKVHGRQLLLGLQELTGVDTSLWLFTRLQHLAWRSSWMAVCFCASQPPIF